ncbi:hypothetical protein AKJ49_02355 [candidate division MSBL1 archaeon SCGC-AAA382A03]|uniref:Cobalamin-binding protein n=1 Tax=candidate division MSBL1 archaeon SCGC-AAA382A03 TaxID=1698278 RepID=A0A133VCF4_9EURY|nr:hypothetical protein AKJ49_02355 [candidate division MSBL1 archaeon SCGC-AAA382A03]
MMGELSESLADLEEEKTLNIVKERIDVGEEPIEILEDCRDSMETIGDKFESGEFFLAELVMAAEIFQEAMDIVIPELKETGEEVTSGKIVIGTVEGDIHDIGKNIAIALLKAQGFEVEDLGVDISPQEFVDAVKESDPPILGMSSLLTMAIEPMKDTIEAIEDSDLREGLRIIVGGSRMDEETCEYVGADAWVDNANKGVKICKEWVEDE